MTDPAAPVKEGRRGSALEVDEDASSGAAARSPGREAPSRLLPAAAGADMMPAEAEH